MIEFAPILQQVESAAAQVADIEVASTALREAQDARDAVQTALATEQAKVDAARVSLSGEQGEAVAELQALVESLNAVIAQITG